jgi:hypothetical protein
VGAVWVEGQPGIDRLGEVGVERFSDFGEVRVDRVEERIVGENEFSRAVFDFKADLLPDFYSDGTAGECTVEGGDGADGVVGVVTGKEVEGRSNRVELRVLAVEVESNSIHDRELTVAAGDTDVNRADVDAGEKGVDGRDVFENVRMDIDLQDFLESGRGRCRGEEWRSAESENAEKGAKG